jgi:hypothetical protein
MKFESYFDYLFYILNLRLTVAETVKSGHTNRRDSDSQDGKKVGNSQEMLRWKQLAAAKSTLLAHVNRELVEQMQIHEKHVSELIEMKENEISLLRKIAFCFLIYGIPDLMPFICCSG